LSDLIIGLLVGPLKTSKISSFHSRKHLSIKC